MRSIGARRSAAGGRRAEGHPTRLYYEPTVIDAVPVSAEVATEETFGPIAPLIRLVSDEELLAAANASEHGLVAAVFTQSLRRAWYFAERLESGTVVCGRERHVELLGAQPSLRRARRAGFGPGTVGRPPHIGGVHRAEDDQLRRGLSAPAYSGPNTQDIRRRRVVVHAVAGSSPVAHPPESGSYHALPQQRLSSESSGTVAPFGVAFTGSLLYGDTNRSTTSKGGRTP